MARRLPTMLDYTRTALSWRSLGHRQPTEDEVIGLVRQYHHDSLLAVLLRLNLALTHPKGLTQEQILRSWAAPEHATALLNLVRRDGAEVIFHEAQVLNLIRLALLYAPTDAGSHLLQIGEFVPLTNALLMMTDLIFPIDSRVDTRAAVFSNFTRTEVFLHDEAYLPNTIARSFDLFLMLPRLLHLRGAPMDLPGMFRQTTGLEVADYLGLGFGVLSFYDAINANAIGADPIAVSRASFFQNTLLPPEIHDRLWASLSLPLQRYRDALRTEWGGGGRWTAMRVFSDFPMIELQDGSLVCVSRRLLRDRFTHGMYWLVANGLEGADRDRFTEFFGGIFEEYVRRSFLRALGHSFHPQATYGPDERPLVDGGLLTTRSLGLVECKAGRLLLRVREEGREADLQASVENMLERAAAQLWHGIQAGQAGSLLHLGVNPVDARYHPILVTYEPLPAHPYALELYERILYRDARLWGHRVRPVLLLDTRDVESLEGIIHQGEPWPDLFSRKHTERFKFLPFHNYLYERFRGGIPPNPYLHARWKRVGEHIGTRLFGEPLTIAG